MTTFHVSTYMQMGDDFDSRSRFLKQPAGGVYQGQIVAGETWSVKVDKTGTNNYLVRLRFKMGNFVFDYSPGDSIATTGVSTGISTG